MSSCDTRELRRCLTGFGLPPFSALPGLPLLSLFVGDTLTRSRDDWRVDEFRDLLEREKGWRTKVYRWWLTVWDASAEDYLFDPADSDDYGFPKTRLDGRPWDYQPKKKKKRYLTSNV